MKNLELLYSKLEKDRILKQESLDSLIHALVDIKKSIDEVYNVYIPELLKNKSHEKLKELLWDIREEFRHIDYHIKDADLTNLTSKK